MSKTKTGTSKVDLGVSKRKQKSEVKSAPKPKRKQVKVLEPVPGVNSPAPDTVASKEPAPSSATKPKPIKGVLKSSKSSAPIEKSAASDVVKKDSKKGKASKPQPHSPSVSAANAADKKSSLKAEKKSSTIRSPASSLKQVVSEEENGTLLTGFEAESDDEEGDSSDEDTDEEGLAQASEFDAKHLPKAIKRLRSESKNPKQNEPPTDNTGVIYLGRIPHGFHEEEMSEYFNQFGETCRVRLSRNRRTGKSKHYGFIEFRHREVAQIVAETLQDYLLCGNMLQCKLLEKDEVHPRLWVGSGRKFRRDWKLRLSREKHNQPKSVEQQVAISDRLIKREALKRKRLEDLGIVYDFPGYCSPVEPTKSTKPSKKKKNKSLKEDIVSESKGTTATDLPEKPSEKDAESIPSEQPKSQPKKKKARKST